MRRCGQGALFEWRSYDLPTVASVTTGRGTTSGDDVCGSTFRLLTWKRPQTAVCATSTCHAVTPLCFFHCYMYASSYWAFMWGFSWIWSVLLEIPVHGARCCMSRVYVDCQDHWRLSGVKTSLKRLPGCRLTLHLKPVSTCRQPLIALSNFLHRLNKWITISLMKCIYLSFLLLHHTERERNAPTYHPLNIA